MDELDFTFVRQKEGMIYILIYFKKRYLMFLFSFIIGTPASWNGNGLYYRDVGFLELKWTNWTLLL
jgi:hypothetical protein